MQLGKLDHNQEKAVLFFKVGAQNRSITSCGPLLADLFLYSYEAEFVQKLLQDNTKQVYTDKKSELLKLKRANLLQKLRRISTPI
jgi:hypothetical protein